MSEDYREIEVSDLSKYESIMYDTLRMYEPDLEIFYDHGRYYLSAGGGSLCGSPYARAQRSQEKNCCIGGPCFQPCSGETIYEALAYGLVGKL